MTGGLPEECLRSVDSQVTMCKQFVLRRVFAISSISDECLRPVGSQLSLCDQLVPS